MSTLTVSTTQPVAPTIAPPSDVAVTPLQPARRRRRGSKTDAKLAVLQDAEVLAGCRRADLTQLGASAELMRFAAGVTVAKDVDARRWWWMPLDGRMAVVVDGRPATVIGPGEGAGLTTSPEAPARLTLVALEEVTILVAERRTLLAVTDTSPRIAAVVARSLGRRAEK
jgi:hypothetical protein